MEIILRESVASLGRVGDVVSVSDGYARNYLLPKCLAYIATEANRKKLGMERRILEARQEEHLKEARELAKKIEETTITIRKQTGEEDKLYGSVNSSDIEKGLAAAGITVDRKQITFTGAIKTLGDHEVAIHLYADVVARCKVKVEKG